MSIVEVLNDSFPRVQLVGIVDVVEPKEEVVRSTLNLFIHGRNLFGVLSCICGTILNGSIHADPIRARSSPLTPSIAILAAWVWTVVGVQDIC